jgi:hypothetical protein
MKSGELPYCFSLQIPGESRVTNQEFLLSYIRFTAWLRLIGAHEQIVLLKSAELEPMRRMSAVATIYEKVGMQIEDLACTFIAWMCRARNKDLLIADLLNRIVLVRHSRSNAGRDDAYAERCVDELVSDPQGRVRVDMARFFANFHAKRGSEILWMLGLPWKDVPSIKTARGDELQFWRKLPGAISALVSQLGNTGTDSMGALFNKIKHGPQMVVVNLIETFRGMKGGAEVAARMSESFHSAQVGAETLRILLDGASTEMTETHRATVFIDDFVPAIEQVVYRSMFPPTKTMWWIACWIAKIEYGYIWEKPHPVQLEFERWACGPSDAPAG